VLEQLLVMLEELVQNELEMKACVEELVVLVVLVGVLEVVGQLEVVEVVAHMLHVVVVVHHIHNASVEVALVLVQLHIHVSP
jgi:hypothetical protein